MTTKPALSGLATHAVMVLLALVAVVPVYWMVATALRPETELFSTTLWPTRPSLEHFA